MRTGMLLFALLAAGSPAVAATLAPGDIVVSGVGLATPGVTLQGLLRVDPLTGAQTLIAAGDFGDFSMLGRDTIYALSGTSVVEVETASGNQRVVSTGGSFVAPSGIAVDANSGRLFVLDYEALGGDGAIFEIDPSTGAQSVLTTAGFLLNYPSFFSNTDLEIRHGVDLITLGPRAIQGSGDIWSVDLASGLQTDLYHPTIELTLGATGLGVAPNGDIYLSNGMRLSTHVVKIDAITGIATIAGDVTNFDLVDFDLVMTDIAILHDGTGFLTGGTDPTTGGNGSVFPWDVSPRLDADGTAFSPGLFNEVQVVVPEPSTALLCAAGTFWLALRARESRRCGATRQQAARRRKNK